MQLQVMKRAFPISVVSNSTFWTVWVGVGWGEGGGTSLANASSALQFFCLFVFFFLESAGKLLLKLLFFQHALLLCDTPRGGQTLSGVGHVKTCPTD